MCVFESLIIMVINDMFNSTIARAAHRNSCRIMSFLNRATCNCNHNQQCDLLIVIFFLRAGINSTYKQNKQTNFSSIQNFTFTVKEIV